MLYILHGELTGADEAGVDFLTHVETRARLFHPTSVLRTGAAVGLTNVGSDDGVVFVIGDDPTQEAVDFLGLAKNKGAVIMPIALDAPHRRPPDVVGAAQSFDVVDAVRRAGLSPGHQQWAARAFARLALSRLAPTCFRSRLRLFLSYRRADGEDLTAELDRALSERHEHVFRDLVEVQAGDPAQDIIDESLAGADVVIFIDTPRAGESDWVAHELATAMGNGIPVVWVRLGPTGNRVPLPVPPGDAPLVDVVDPSARDVGELADDVLDAAFDQVREAIRAATGSFGVIRRWAEEQGASVTVLDQRRLIYAVQLASVGEGTFPRRSRQDIVQLFARSPDRDDVDELKEWLRGGGYSEHPLACRAFDAAVLVRPTSLHATAIEDWGVVGSGDAYLAEIGGRPAVKDESHRPTLLLLGAFPAEPESHPAVIAAVSSLARSWLAWGGIVTFGSHPTFTPLVAEAGRSVLPPGASGRIRAYRSEYFPKSSFEATLQEGMALQEVPAAGDLYSSLTAMRRAMIRAHSAHVAVIIGGRTSEGGTHAPGVEEELALARDAAIPSVVLGSAGGQAAAIAERERQAQPPWTGLANGLPDEVNDLLVDEDDYAHVARVIWANFGSQGRE